MPGKVIAELDCAERLRQLVTTQYVPDSPTHDVTHLARVAALGARICQAEGGDKLIVVMAAWLHDLHRDARSMSQDFFTAPEETDARVREYLIKADVPDDMHDRIIEAIHYTDRFSFSDRPIYATSIEAKILRDADCIDAIGAIGVARSFSFGGAHGIPIWEESELTEPSTFKQTDRPSSTIRHFYDKLLRLYGELETSAGREIARQRSSYMEAFVRQFMMEWREDVEYLNR